jgi:hypothetical protein
MKSASELLEAYLNNVATPKVSASQFAEDGVLELPWVKAYARGPTEVEKLLVGLRWSRRTARSSYSMRLSTR